MHIQPWNLALVTGTYMFTPGPAKPHVLQSKELPLNTGQAGGPLTQGDESKAPQASNKLLSLARAVGQDRSKLIPQTQIII